MAGAVTLVGKTLGHYEILEPLGKGGMGEVYRARDTTLKRDVAVKVLSAEFVDDPDRLARLEREAHLLASLNHPNIATIHSLEHEGDTRFLVLELVKGDSLERRLAAGPLTVEKAVDFGKQIAEALEAAHGEGIIHRDLKPANVVITPEGRAKVLDFGIAKTVAAATNVGTQATNLTVAGTLVGTVPFMSPEQIRGEVVDKRADIWAFGCLLYEMLTGGHVFGRETVADTLAAIIEQEPDWGALPTATPDTVRSLLHRCLQKDPKLRLRDIGDAWVEMHAFLTDPSGVLTGPALIAGNGERAVPAGRFAAPWIAAALAVGASLGALGVWYFTGAQEAPGPPPTPRPVTRFQIGFEESGLRLSGGHFREGEGRSFQRPSGSAMALSPDGKYLVYLATDLSAGNADGIGARQLYRHAMNRGRATPIEGTVGASDPFFSPDGQWIGFAADGGLRRVPVGGGDPVMVFPDWKTPPSGGGEAGSYGASWGDDGTIVVAAGSGGLLAGPETGGTLEPLTTLDANRGESSHRLPHMLPGSKAVLFTVLMIPGDWERAEITAQVLETGERKTLIVGGSDARYVPTGHLLFARDGVLMAVGFDPERLEITGQEVVVIDQVLHSIDHGQSFLNTGTAHFAISDTGTLLYAGGGSYPEVMMSLLRVDQDGESQPFPLAERRYLNVRLSPDGKQLAYTAGPGNRIDVWTYDIARDVPRPMTTKGFTNRNVIWSPDGKWIAFGSNRDGPALNLYRKAADGSGVAERLTTSDRDQNLHSWSVDGVIAFTENRDIWLLPDPSDPASTTRPFFESRFEERHPTFSPDGRWIAYTSDESGQREVVVRPYPGPDPPTPITGGGRTAAEGLAWARDGQELYFVRPRPFRMMAAELSYGSTLQPGDARQVFASDAYSSFTGLRPYDMDDDGFVMISRPPAPPQPVTQINVILNWFEELKQRVPTGGQR